MFEFGVFDAVAENNLEGLSRFSVLTHLSVIPPRMQAFSAFGARVFSRGGLGSMVCPFLRIKSETYRKGIRCPHGFLIQDGGGIDHPDGSGGGRDRENQPPRVRPQECRYGPDSHRYLFQGGHR